jgi:MFS family permease
MYGLQMLRVPPCSTGGYASDMSLTIPPKRQTDPADEVPLDSRSTLAALAVSMLLSSLGTSIANVGLPELARAFDASFQQVQWIVLAYLLAVTATIVGAGRLGDLVGRRRLLLSGIALFTAASALCGVTPWLWLLVAARAVQGLGAAVMMALAVALVGAGAAKGKTGGAMGLLGTASAAGTALGPVLGGLLIAAFSWRALFLVNLPLGAAAFLLVLRVRADLRESPGAGGRFDLAGTSLLAATLSAYALAMTLGRGSFGPLNIALLCTAGVGLGLFLALEARTASPLLPPALLRETGLSAGLGMNALVSTVMMATLVVGPFYLARGLGLGAAAVGLALAAGPLAAALAGLPAGRMADRLGAFPVITMGLASLGVGCAVLAVMPAAFGAAGYVAAMVVATIGYALFQAANTSAVMAQVRPEQRGLVSGLLSLSRNLGLVTGASAMGAVFALGSATGEMATAPPEAVAAGMRMTFAVATFLALSALGIAAGTLLTPRRASRAARDTISSSRI